MTAPTGLTVRDRVVDIGCLVAAVSGAMLIAGEAEASGRITGRPVIFLLLLAAPACVAILWRRRRPVTVALAILPVSAVSEFSGVAALIAVFAVAARRPLRIALAVAAAHAVAAVPYLLVVEDPDLTPVGTNVLNVVVIAVAVALGAATRPRRELLVALRERAARAEAELALRTERERAMERQRIAREMHDVLAHRISQVSLYAGALELREDLSGDQARRAAGVIRASAHQALEDLREILGVLRSGVEGDPPHPASGLAELDELITQCRAAGLVVAAEIDAPPPETVSPLVSRTAYRVVQEALTNAGKHAPGEPVSLRLARSASGELTLAVRNGIPSGGGVGIPGARVGLIGLAERVGLAGGRIEYGVRRGPSGDVGFCLQAWLPCPG